MKLNKFYWHPYFFAIWPILALYDYNKDIANINYLWRPLLVVLVVAILLHLIFTALTKHKARAAILTSAFFILFFSFGHFINILNNSQSSIYYIKYNLNDIYYYSFLFIWLLIFIFISLFLTKSKKEFVKFNYYLNTLSLILILFSVFSISTFIYQHKDKALVVDKENMPDIVVDVNKNPDIYYLVFDSYARQDILEEFYNYDNTNFINYLENKDFYVAKQSTANYPQTFLSMASALNMDYLDNIISYEGNANDYRYRLKESIKNSQSYQFLKDRGYQFVTLPAAWVGIANSLPSDISIEQGFSSNDFESILIDTAFGNKLRFLDQDKRNKFNFLVDNIGNITDIDQPTFAYIHFLPPHPPFIFDAQGNNRSSKDGPSANYWAGAILMGDQEASVAFKERYIDQIIFINSQIEKIVDDLLNRSPQPPVIIIQGDHGANSMVYIINQNEDSMRERMSILNAYYLPDNLEESFYETITPVNSFRVIFNQIFDTDLEILPDRNFHAPYTDLYKFTEITQDLQ